jgi:hypothetical protein
MGPLLFCLGLKALTATLPASDLAVFYLDDGTFGGTAEQVVAVYETIRLLGPKIGLVVNEAKTEICPLGTAPAPPEFATCSNTHHSQLTLLGSPIGFSPEQLSSPLKAKLDQLETLSGSIKGLATHHQLHLLRNCLLIPKLLFTLRSSPTFQSPEALAEIDTAIKQILAATMNQDWSDSAWTQASLPTRHGGLGIRAPSQLALPAFLSSISATRDLSDIIAPASVQHSSSVFDSALSSWKGFVPPDTSTPSPTSAVRQKSWDEPISKAAINP